LVVSTNTVFTPVISKLSVTPVVECISVPEAIAPVTSKATVGATVEPIETLPDVTRLSLSQFIVPLGDTIVVVLTPAKTDNGIKDNNNKTFKLFML